MHSGFSWACLREGYAEHGARDDTAIQVRGARKSILGQPRFERVRGLDKGPTRPASEFAAFPPYDFTAPASLSSPGSKSWQTSVMFSFNRCSRFWWTSG